MIRQIPLRITSLVWMSVTFVLWLPSAELWRRQNIQNQEQSLCLSQHNPAPSITISWWCETEAFNFQHVTCTFQLQLISMEDNGTMTFCDQFNGSIKLKMEATVLYCTTEEHISTWMKWMFTRKIYKYPYILWKVKYCWYKPSCCDIRSNDKAFYQSFSFKSVVNIHGEENRRNNNKVVCDEIKVLDHPLFI